MKGKFATLAVLLVVLSMIATTVLVGCGPATQAPAPTQAVEKPTEAPPPPPTEAPTAVPTEAPPAKVVNRAGVELPDDAAPIEEQVLRLPSTESTWMSWDTSLYDLNTGPVYGIHDSCVRPDKEFEPQPSGCESWEVSDDGLTWTFHLPKDKVWSDGTPVTADDWVFTLQRYARADYDFFWYYSMAGIVNFFPVMNGELPPEELGVKAVDDYTFTVTTEQPTPFLVKLFSFLWVAPKHIVKDRLADGTWAFDPATAVSAGPYKLDHWTKGKEIVWVANDKYTGPFPPMMDQIHIIFMDPKVRFAAYKNGEVDIIGYGTATDLPPAAMAEVMADPEMKKHLYSWPNFDTYYFFFDTWNPPFDNLKVRQAFSHAIDRDAIVNGPLQYQAIVGYTMNPPGFPGESVEKLKSVQNYDPELAAQLMEEAGYPGGKGFPKLTMYTRSANPALTSAAEVIIAMLKENLGVEAEIQDLDWGMYMDKLSAQKKDKGGDMIFALVPYEYDFVDGSNMLGVWGGCEQEGADLSDMPGRHAWYNKEYNGLLCEANALMGDEAKRNELYQKAEKILIEDVALVPIYHSIMNTLLNPNLKGPVLEPNKAGVITVRPFIFDSTESRLYRAK